MTTNDKLEERQGPCRYLKTTEEVLNQGSSVGAHRNVTVEFSKARLGYLSSVFANIFLSQVEL